jgi:phage baseplate assembly protein W
MGHYYKIPLQLGIAMEGNEIQGCDLDSSIKRNLDLIIMTKFGEHRCDPSYGCEIWDLDFELIVSARLWEEKLRQSLMKSITTHEYRLAHTEIVVAITDIERFSAIKNATEIKKRVDIQVSGTIKKTGEPFFFNTNLFLSPLSVD